AIDAAGEEASAAVAREDFAAAMRAMATLRPHVDAFFDKVTVNVAEGADKDKLRDNRLRLLNEIRAATQAVADFSRIEGYAFSSTRDALYSPAPSHRCAQGSHVCSER